MLNNMSFHDLLCLQPLSPMGLRRLFRFQEILLFLRTSEIHPTRFVSFLSLTSVKQTRLMLGRVAMHSSLSLLSWICSCLCVHLKAQTGSNKTLTQSNRYKIFYIYANLCDSLKVINMVYIIRMITTVHIYLVLLFYCVFFSKQHHIPRNLSMYCWYKYVQPQRKEENCIFTVTLICELSSWFFLWVMLTPLSVSVQTIMKIKVNCTLIFE